MSPTEEMSWPSGVVTFLFTDVQGSTRLWAADPDAMSASTILHDTVVRDAIESHDGYVFTTAGDSFAAAFERASDAVAAAGDAQFALASTAWPGPELQVRMGLHLGRAEERSGDYFGIVVNTTARVEAAGHGGQILITDAVREAAGIEATDLGFHQLRDVDEPVHLFQVGAGDFPALRAADPAKSNLPARPTRLIGRDDEITEVRRLLTAERLVTITAIGGSGKTRLAIGVGEAELVHRPGGVWFVDLTAIVNGADLPAAIAASVGLTLAGTDPTEQVIRYLADKPALLILDNCEHIIDECAAFTQAFLATKGQAVLVATSREALDVDGERIVLLGSLPTNSTDSPGVRLFLDRATAVRPDFSLTEANTSLVAAVCARLDGIPLAIELAAARVTVMTPSELLAGLDDRFSLLSAGRRQRHRTLGATLDWSYDLLDPDEQRVFRTLGVFVDGFDLDAVASVTESTLAAGLRSVDALVSKSLVVRDDAGDRARFRLLETVKAYAEKRLGETGETAHVRDRHAGYFHERAMTGDRVAQGLLGVGARLRHDTSNLTSALEWTASCDRWVAAGELLLGSSMAYFMSSRILEFRSLILRAIDGCPPDDPELADYLRTQLIFASGMLNDAGGLAGNGRELTESDHPAFRAIGWTFLAWLPAAYGQDESTDDYLVRAQTELDQALPVAESISVFAADYLSTTRLVIALRAGDYEAALDHGRRALAGIPGHEDSGTFLHVAATNTTAICEVLLGRPGSALSSVDWLDRFDLSFHDGTEIRTIAHLELGDLDRARDHVRTHAQRGASGRLVNESCDSVMLLAALAHAEGDDHAACSLLLAAGIGRLPAVVAYGNHLAARLGVEAEHEQAVREARAPDNVHGAGGTKRSMAALRAELARRGWE